MPEKTARVPTHDHAEPSRAETPFLPRPLASEVLEATAQAQATLDACEAQRTTIEHYRHHIAAAIDTVELAIQANHANYLGGRRSWSYETRIEVETRLRILKRQRQHLQEAFGQCNRRIKHLENDQRLAQPKASANGRATLFVEMATRMLAPETIAMLWEQVDTAQRNLDAPSLLE